MLPEIVVGFHIITFAEMASKYEYARKQKGEPNPKASKVEKFLAIHF